MLVVTRKQGESVRVGRATVSIVRVRGDAVRLGIDAPLNIEIARGEIPPRTQREEPEYLGEGIA